ncbi:MAG TPA: hypothetical protein VFN55_03630 [Solirubrobacteraceae bacterium]|nr:hypothetical protein [Solirubrobacteraceae bacterium]
MLHLKFRRIATQVYSSVQASGDYLGYPPSFPRSSAASPFVLVNDRTGKQIKLQPCRGRGIEPGPGILHYPWVGFDCGGAKPYRIYNIVTHKWHSLGCNACKRHPYLVDMTAIGADWVGLSVAPHQACGDGIHGTCGPTTYLYENVVTGASRTPRLRAGSVVDLDSPSLTSRLCKPLQVPQGTGGFPNPFTFFGRYTLAFSRSGIYVERCGSRLHLPLIVGSNDFTSFGNTKAVGACNRRTSTGAAPTLQGVFLPSLRRYQVDMPSNIGCPQSIALGPHHIAVTSGLSLWVAAFP